VPDSFEECLTQGPKLPINLTKAKRQHRNYINTLKSLVTNVIEVPRDDAYPDSCFIEDTAVVVDNRALVTRPGAKERDGEQNAIATVFSTLLPSGSISKITPPGTLDGGDVMFTGKDLFVGLSSRTNTEAAQQLRLWFSDIPVWYIPIQGTLHLKCIVTPFDRNTLVVAETPLGRKIINYINEKLNNSYKFVMVPDIPPSNLVRIGDTIIIQEGFPQTQNILKQLATEHNVKVVCLDMSELIKADGSLTCGSILFNIK